MNDTAAVGQVEVLSRAQPVLAIYEDAQWFDPSTLEGIGLLIDRAPALRVLVLIAFRPDFAPPWRSHGNITSLSLSRLARRDGAHIIARLTGGRSLPPELEEQLLARADGIPLFVEELTKVVLESGLLEEAGDQYAVKGPSPALAIPASLQDSLMARLDRLAPVKEVAQVAAVIGREFPFGLLAMVASRQDEELRAALARLEEAELVYRRGLPPDAIYTFKHALVQDAAYQSLLKSRRQQLHARIADALSQIGTTPEVLARHYTEAGLLEPAAGSWAKAGHEALARSAMHEAAKAFRNALGLLRKQPPSAKRERQELDLLVPLSVALINTTGPGSADVEAVQREAAAIAAGLGDREGEFRARWLLWRVHNVRAELEQAVGIARGLCDDARRDGDPDRELHALHALWSSSLFRGDLQATVRHVEEALELYDPARHSTSAMVLGGHDAKECGLTNGGNALFLLGYPEQALNWNRAGLAHALELGHPQVVVHALNWNIILPQLLDDLDDIRARLDMAAPLIEDHGLAMYYAEARILEAWLAVRCDADRRAAEVMREHLERRTAMGTTFVQTYFFTLIAGAWLRVGDPAEALVTVEQGIRAARATGEHFFTAELFRLAGRARLALEGQDSASAEANLHDALADARSRRARLWELRAARDLARLWAEQGERQKAHDLLAPVYDWFTEGFDTADLKDAKALLDELS